MKAINRNQEVIPFIKYLKKNNYSRLTINGYAYGIGVFLREMKNPSKAAHIDILRYFSQKTNFSNKSKQRRLLILKKYYDYLIDAGIRETHPCKTFNIRTFLPKVVLESDLLTKAELESMLDDKYYHFEGLKIRNQVIVSLLIFQALTPCEITNLKLIDFNWHKKTVFASAGRKLKARELPLEQSQISMIKKYLKGARKKLARKKKSEFFILNFYGVNNRDPTCVEFTIRKMRHLFPDKILSPKLIRNSVISYWLNKKKLPLDQVQLLAGYRLYSSIKNRETVPIQEEIKSINKWFPL